MIKVNVLLDRYFDDFKNYLGHERFTENALVNYINVAKDKLAPSSLRVHVSGIKSILKSQYNIKAQSWELVSETLTSIGKHSEHETKKSKSFTEEEFQNIFTVFSDDGKDLVVKTVAALSTISLSRGGSTKKLTCDDVSFNAVKERIEVAVPKIKQRSSDFSCGPSPTQEYFVEGKELVRIIQLYKSKIHPDHGGDTQFIKNFNLQCGLFCQSMGKNNMASIPQLVATRLGLPNPDHYTGHAWRRTGAKLGANAGASTPQLKQAGQWKSEKAMYEYIDTSDLAKSGQAQIFSSIVDGKTNAPGLSSSKKQEFKELPQVVNNYYVGFPEAAAPAVNSFNSYFPQAVTTSSSFNMVLPQADPVLRIPMVWDIMARDPQSIYWKFAPQSTKDKAFEAMRNLQE